MMPKEQKIVFISLREVKKREEKTLDAQANKYINEGWIIHQICPTVDVLVYYFLLYKY